MENEEITEIVCSTGTGNDSYDGNLSKLDWFCIHDSVDVFYVCKYCNERRDNIGYGRGGDTYVEWDDLRDKNFKKYTHSVNGKTCTCRDFVRKQYGCWWLNVKMAPKEAEFGKYMTVTSKILREGKMEAYEFNPVKVTFSRCKHEGELVYVGSTEEYGPKNIVIDDYEHNRYQCMDCGAIMYKKDIKKKI